jgi:peptide/nickel transport system substrate-binding protein
MTKKFHAFFLSFLVLSALLSGLFIRETGAGQKVQYGGIFKYLDKNPQINPMSWDNAEWNWKNSYDSGFFMEHLIVGDLQKGPRGAKKYSFTATAYVPAEDLRGELVEKWEVKKNPLRIIFQFRKGVLWQEKPGVMKSREFTAEDVAYSMTRKRNAKRAIPSYFDFIERLEVADKYKLVLHLKTWDADWKSLVGWGYHSNIQAPEQEKAPGGAGRWENVTGTGPYMLTDYKEGHSQTYEKNPKYWDSEIIDGKKYQLPFTDKVVMMIIKDEITQVSALSTGKIDLMMSLDWKHVANLKKSNPQLQWARRVLPPLLLALRMDMRPFNDIRVRRALNMAVDKQVIIDSLFGGNAEMISFPFSKDFASVFTPLEKLPPSARELFSYNPEKAKKLLTEAGYPNGFTFKAQIDNSNQVILDVGALVAGYLAKIGVKMELDIMDYPSWLAKMTKKEHPPGIFFIADHGTPLSSIRKVFLSGEKWNLSIMKDPYVDKIWNETSENPDLTEKEINAAMKQLAVYCIDQAPFIWLPGIYKYMAWWPWVKNYYGEVTAGAQRSGPVITRIWIDQELKKKMGY